MSGDQGSLTPPVGPDDHVQGPHDASVTLLEYGDYECSYCGKAYPIVKRIQERLGNRLRFNARMKAFRVAANVIHAARGLPKDAEVADDND